MAVDPAKIKAAWDRLPAWAKTALYAADRWVNWRLGGDPDMTVSERLARARNQGDLIGMVGCKLLDRYDPGHCDRAIKHREGDA